MEILKKYFPGGCIHSITVNPNTNWASMTIDDKSYSAALVAKLMTAFKTWKPTEDEFEHSGISHRTIVLKIGERQPQAFFDSMIKVIERFNGEEPSASSSTMAAAPAASSFAAASRPTTQPIVRDPIQAVQNCIASSTEDLKKKREEIIALAEQLKLAKATYDTALSNHKGLLARVQSLVQTADTAAAAAATNNADNITIVISSNGPAAEASATSVTEAPAAAAAPAQPTVNANAPTEAAAANADGWEEARNTVPARSDTSLRAVAAPSYADMADNRAPQQGQDPAPQRERKSKGVAIPITNLTVLKKIEAEKSKRNSSTDEAAASA